MGKTPDWVEGESVKTRDIIHEKGGNKRTFIPAFFTRPFGGKEKQGTRSAGKKQEQKKIKK